MGSNNPDLEFEVVCQEDEGPEIYLNPQQISHAFVGLLHEDSHLSEKASAKVADLNRYCQPRVWEVPFQAKFFSFTSEAMGTGHPDIMSVPKALENVGIKNLYSVVVNMLTVTMDGGKTNSNILVGFAFADERTRIILPRTDGCIPV